MTTESAIFLGAILFAFAGFGVVVAWVDAYSGRRHSTNQPAE